MSLSGFTGGSWGWGGGGGSASSLSAVLAVGNTTGANDIVVSAGKKISGVPAAAGVFDVSNNGGANSYLRLRSVVTGGSVSIQADQQLIISTNFGGAIKQWYFATSGSIIAGTDNAQDIGASGASRPRTIYAGTSVITPRAVNVSAAGAAVSANAPRTAYSNSGAVGAGAWTLPVAAAGLEYDFVQDALFSMAITANGTDTITYLGTVSSAGGTLTSDGTTRGAWVKIRCTVAGNWNVVSAGGGWTPA